jgi:hypothetical protein
MRATYYWKRASYIDRQREDNREGELAEEDIIIEVLDGSAGNEKA